VRERGGARLDESANGHEVGHGCGELWIEIVMGCGVLL
jgi:hypothetical protein